MSAPAPEIVPVVAVINTSEEISALLTVVLQMEGFRVVTAYVPDVKRGDVNLGDFLAEHRPRAVIWDIAIPYEANWGFFQAVAASEAGQTCRFVLTTTNKEALESLVGPTPAHELIGKPYDLDEVIRAVREALEA